MAAPTLDTDDLREVVAASVAAPGVPIVCGGMTLVSDDDGRTFVTGTDENTPLLVDLLRTTRELPPASIGLRAPADVSSRADARRREQHPAKRGRMSDEKRDEFVGAVVELMDKLTATEIAVQTGAGTDGRSVKEVILAARSALQRRAEFYTHAHALATIRAAAEGDAKPSQWALERIAEGEDRVVDPQVKEAAPPAPPTLSLGFVIGGVPMQVQSAPAPAAIEGEVVR